MRETLSSINIHSLKPCLKPQSTMTNAVPEAAVLSSDTNEFVLNYKTCSVRVLARVQTWSWGNLSMLHPDAMMPMATQLCVFRLAKMGFIPHSKLKNHSCSFNKGF